MTTELFLSLLIAFAACSSLVTEAVKTITKGKFNSNIVALIVALIVTIPGMFIYYTLGGININLINVIYAILMGLASSITSMVGYDKVKAMIINFIK